LRKTCVQLRSALRLSYAPLECIRSIQTELRHFYVAFNAGNGLEFLSQQLGKYPSRGNETQHVSFYKWKSQFLYNCLQHLFFHTQVRKCLQCFMWPVAMPVWERIRIRFKSRRRFKVKIHVLPSPDLHTCTLCIVLHYIALIRIIHYTASYITRHYTLPLLMLHYSALLTLNKGFLSLKICPLTIPYTVSETIRQ
jgi:hypothetical protein